MDNKQLQIDKLMEEGFELIEEGQYDQAITTAKKLKELRHTSNFEIMALAYLKKDDVQEAISVLTEGVKLAPKAWILWQLLGNVYSDEQLPQKAQYCYESALKCPNTDKNSIYLNSSIAYVREENFLRALDLVDRITDKNLYMKAASQKIFIWMCLEKYQKAIQLGSSIMSSDQWDFDLYSPEDLSSVSSSLSEVHYALKEYQKATDLAWDAIRIFKGDDKAAWLIRDIEGEISDKSKYFRLMLQGVWYCPFNDKDERPGFYTNYDVVANDETDALEFVKRFEPKEVHESIKIEEVHMLKDAPKSPQGIYSTSGYFFFPLNEKI